MAQPKESQALEAVQGQLELPVSQEYQRQEIENVVAACHAIEREVFEGGGEGSIHSATATAGPLDWSSSES
jgi:hypothetical protein